jgi:class 3 adenylate cyclase
VADGRRSIAEWCAWVWRSVSADRPSALELLLGHEQGVRVFRRVASWWGAIVGLIVVVLLLLLIPDDVPGLHWGWALTGAIAAALLGLGFLASGDRATERILTVVCLLSIPFMAIELWLFGPRFEMGLVAPVLAGLQSLLFLRRRLAVAAHLLLAVSYGVVVATQDGYPAPAARLLLAMGVLTTTSSVFGWVVGHIEALSKNEREAREALAKAHAELAAANTQLASQLEVQGEEIGSLQQLRQFLSPQVAEAVLQEGMDALAPHRARIAVVFCDLRGFTTFSTSAEPEEVMEVLDRYYVTVGRALHDGGATVGSFAGDGIMAYFGDPVPHDDPAGTAVQMAVDLSEQMRTIVSGWRRRGFDIGCGLGIAYGYATIGPVGFDERTDYTALGPTVNLASRLCNMAADGEILIDGRAHEAVEDRVVCEERIVEVRGFRLPVHAYNVTAWTG